MKTVIDVKNPIQPHDEDVLVYNAREKCYEQVRKAHFQREVNEQISDLKNEIAQLKQANLELRNDIVSVVKIVKENINK